MEVRSHELVERSRWIDLDEPCQAESSQIVYLPLGLSRCIGFVIDRIDVVGGGCPTRAVYK